MDYLTNFIICDEFKKELCGSETFKKILFWYKTDAAMAKLALKQNSRKTDNIKGIAKLEDANDATTNKNSWGCCLIITEGDSAKPMALAGLSTLGRDKYGVYPLMGKLPNVREADAEKIIDNKEITELVKIIGLVHGKEYKSKKDLKKLRYQKIMIMADQDQDGSHIKGLIINLIHFYWKSLLKLGFIEEFITPILKAKKGKIELSFFSQPEYEEWKNKHADWNTYDTKHYKGLGGHETWEAEQYFAKIQRHRIQFVFESEDDTHAINMAFNKEFKDQRKDWIANHMEEQKKIKEENGPVDYLYKEGVQEVSYSEFIYKELILFSVYDVERSIPSVVDGFKPGQRKVMFTCLKRNDQKQVKVAQLAGAVGEQSAYHHGEASLTGTMVKLAQNYVGSNNINLLQPNGQFGTRLAGGKDSSAPRYIHTQMSPLAKLIFNPHDKPQLKHLIDDNTRIEPEWYLPILPMILVNGVIGIGTGWSTDVPNFNPRQIVKNLMRMMDNEEPESMHPFFKNFKGEIKQLEEHPHSFAFSGVIHVISPTEIEITELPLREWTQRYKEDVLLPMLGSEEVPPKITSFREYHTDKSVKFVVSMAADTLRQLKKDQGLHQYFRLQKVLTWDNMVLFDQNGVIKTYDDALEILVDFYHIRLPFYEKRKQYLEGKLDAEALKLSNEARLIEMICDGSLKIADKKIEEAVRLLQQNKFEPDPVKKWRADQAKLDAAKIEDVPPTAKGKGPGKGASKGLVKDKASIAKSDPEDLTGGNYNYLLNVNLRDLTKESKEGKIKKSGVKNKEVEKLRNKTPIDLWRDDLDEFLIKLQEVEEEEIAAAGKQPSPSGTLVPPQITKELRRKGRDAATKNLRKKKLAAAEKKKKRRVSNSVSNSDIVLLLFRNPN